jgi:hypothetical protein
VNRLTIHYPSVQPFNIMTTYTGVGSRETPLAWLGAMSRIASRLSDVGLNLRSGGAGGADNAFELGAGLNKEIYVPWSGFNNRSESEEGVYVGACNDALALAQSLHPAWERCSRGARSLHARNCYQVLGRDLKTPSDFLLCWTPGGLKVGGTATAIRLAEMNGVKVFNFGSQASVVEFQVFLGALED